jgi:hypothetical protein
MAAPISVEMATAIARLRSALIAAMQTSPPEGRMISRV